MKRREPCSEWEELLALRLEDLSSADRASLEAHLIMCPACAAINDHYRRIEASLTAFPTPTMEPIPYAWKRESRREGKEKLRQEFPEDILRRYHDYTRTLVRQYVSKASLHAVSEEAFVVDALVQETLIKFYHALEEKLIANPQAFIRCIVRNVYMDWVRKNRGHAFALDESVDVLEISYQSTVDTEQQELRDFIEEIVEQILVLSPCQRQAMFCSLKEHLDDIPLLTEALLRHNINLRNINWPEEEWELQLLRSSLSIARKKLRTIFSQKLERECQLEKAESHSAGQIEVLFGIT